MTSTHFPTPIWLLLLLWTVSGCFRPDEAIAPFEPGSDVTLTEVAMASFDPAIGDTRYDNQVFWDIRSGQLTSVKRTSWDLAFESAEDGDGIYLNSANFMQIAPAGEEFGRSWSRAEINALVFDFDSASGEREFTALAGWRASPGTVYLLDRGLDEQLQPRGYVQIQFLGRSGDGYRFRYARQDGSEPREAIVQGREGYTFAYFSFDKHQTVDVAPPASDWDLSFSYYTYKYPDGITYWLTGTLLNPAGVAATRVSDSLVLWDALSLADTLAFPLSEARDVIGFDWKTYLFGPPARFVTHSEQLYLLRDTEGYYFKLRFLDFYNDQGWKGFPLVETAYLR